MAPEEYSRSSIYNLATGQGAGASPRSLPQAPKRSPGPNFSRATADN